LQLLQVFGRGSRGGVSAISNEVDVHVLNLVVLGASEQGEQVADVRVHTAIRDQTDQVESRAVRGGVLHRVDDGRLLLKLVLLDSWLESEFVFHMKPTLINLDNVLPDDSSSTDV
jgi:hypothetical protein